MKANGRNSRKRGRNLYVALSILLFVIIASTISTNLVLPQELFSKSDNGTPVVDGLVEFKGDAIYNKKEHHLNASSEVNLLHEMLPSVNGKKTAKDLEYHLVFSTGCSLQQNWESYVFFYHAMKVNQPGNVTRLVSGCSQQEEVKLRSYHTRKIKTMSDRFHIFFTDDFGNLENKDFVGRNYKYNNKPNSVYLWMRDVLGMGRVTVSKDVEDDIVLLLDPDMILLRPLLHNFSGQEMLYASRGKRQTRYSPHGNGSKIVQHGMPIAQQDGYLKSHWRTLNVTYITQGGSFPDSARDGPVYWNAGPPYLSTVRDMWAMVKLWKEYVPRVHQEYPELFAEMYGLIIAATQLDLPHTLIKSIVASNPTAAYREAWPFVDNIPDDEVCDIQAWSSNPRMPVILHYCGRYHIGRFFFSKYRLKKKYITCKAPLLTMPPAKAHRLYNYWVRPPPDKGFSHPITVHNLTDLEAKRQTFMTCGLIAAVNEAAMYYKMQYCNGTGNFSQVYNFHDDPYS